MTPRILLAVVAVLALVGAAACGDDAPADVEPGAQPAPDEPRFREDALFESIARVPGSTEFGPATSENGVISQSLLVERTAAEVAEFFQIELVEHLLLEPIAEVAPEAWRGQWVLEDEMGNERRLLVSVTALEPDGEAVDRPRTQYSLVLYPDAEAPPPNPPPEP